MSRQGTSFSPALAAGPDPDHAAGKPNTAAAVAVAAAGSAAGNGETGETLHTTIASGNAEGAETKSSLSMSIMELFDTSNGGAGAGTGVGVGVGAAPVAVTPSARIGIGAAADAAAAAAAMKSPVPAPVSEAAAAAAAPHAWSNANSLTNQGKTAPPSISTGGSGGGRTSLGSVGGAERHGYLSFSEVRVEDDEAGDDRVDTAGGGGGRFPGGSRSSGDAAGHGGREVQPRRLRKRARAWKIFLAVMQDHGLRVRKYHRHGKGWAHRVVKYDPALPGLRWKTSKWWDSSGGQIPLRDVLDVERRGKVVWIKCLHLGTIGFEASLETDAVIFYLAMDSLLDTRCGVGGDGSHDAARAFLTA
eukprot:g2674.t1